MILKLLKRMEEKLKQLLKQEKMYRDNNNYYECFLTCLKILDEINTKNDNSKFDIISKIFLYSNQSNYVRFSLMNSLIQNPSFINNKNTKMKYYQLLIDSFSKGKDKKYSKEINEIKILFEKSQLNNFIDIDKYISNFSYELINKSSLPFDNMNSSLAGESSIINLQFKTPALIDDKNMPIIPQSSLEDINSDRNSEIISTAEDTFSNLNNANNNKESQIKPLFKKYAPNNKMPMIIMSVSVNLNSKQFLNLINENFEKNNYFNICTIKDTERVNIRVYEYHSKNCITNLCSKFLCRNQNSINQFQVSTILKRDENNFEMGINSFLNDIYERKISIKTIRGNQKKVIISIVKFLKSYCLSVDKIQILKQSKCFLKFNLDESLKKSIKALKLKKYNKIYSALSTKEDSENNLKKNNPKKSIGETTLVEKTNDSASKYYELYKIFSKKEYGLGKTISEFIENFRKDYNFSDKENIDCKEIDTKKAMMKIINICEESTNTLNSTFNYDDQNIYDKPAFFTKASEQFILNKIYPVLYNIYDLKYQKDNEIYLKKKKEINNKLKIEEICDKIGIKKKLRGKDRLPFKYVIDIINKIHLEKSLKKKFESITQASLELRNCILEYTNAKFELDSMDDELPIIIYISTQLKVDNLFAELYMIDDYIKCSLRDNLVQNKMVTNLLSSLIYISKEWNFDN